MAHKFGCSVSARAQKIQVICGHGVKGDLHAGPRLSDVRERALNRFGVPRGIQIANVREVSIVAQEELASIGMAMSLPGPIPLGSLGENLVVSGIPDFTALPTGTLLFFQKPDGMKRTAVLAVWGENVPCTTPGEAIQSQFPNQPDLASLFRKAADHRRGVVGFVYSTGYIYEGDEVAVYVPSQRIYRPHTPA